VSRAARSRPAACSINARRPGLAGHEKDHPLEERDGLGLLLVGLRPSLFQDGATHPVRKDALVELHRIPPRQPEGIAFTGADRVQLRPDRQAGQFRIDRCADPLGGRRTGKDVGLVDPLCLVGEEVGYRARVGELHRLVGRRL
jgi:hypothetical protein